MAHPFDDLAKGMAETGGISRRALLMRFVGGLAGAVWASLGTRPARGDPLASVSAGIGAFCVRCCEDVLGFPRPWKVSLPFTLFGRCVIGCIRNPPSVCRARICPSRTTIHVAVCAPGSACCRGVCTDLRTDPQNCGGCGTRCREAGDVCVGRGECCEGTAPVSCGDGLCHPAGTRCCGLGFGGCPFGQKCCHRICIPNADTCCPNTCSVPPC